jgi:hypothetical protein
MQQVSSIIHAGFPRNSNNMGVVRQANQLIPSSVIGQLTKAKMIDLLDAIPQYRPLSTSIRVGSSGDPESEEILKEIEQSLDDETWNLIDAKEELENLQEESNDKEE